MIDWLKTQPLDLKELDAKIAATLRAERLAQLMALQRLAARGKLTARCGSMTSWPPGKHWSYLPGTGRFRGRARTLPGRGAPARRGQHRRQRQRAIDAFQQPDGPQLIVCATRAAAQGITLTRSSNVCFLELEWTPAIHDQAEDRCHRIGQPTP